MEKKRTINLSLALLTVVVVVLLVAWAGFFLLGRKAEVIQGEVEVTEYRVSAKVPGRVLKFYVHEGDKVAAGDTLCVLDVPDLEAKLQQAEAARAAASAQDRKAIHGTREEQLQAAYEVWQKAKAGAEVAQKSYTRVKNLFDQGVVAEQKKDEAAAQCAAAVATERAARSQYEMARNGAQREDKEAAKALVEKAQGAVAEVQSYLKEAVLLAQTAGEISEIYPHLGELVGSGAPIMSVAVTNDLWVTFQMREDMLNSLRVGQQCTGVVPALGGAELPLRVTYMKDLGSFAAWKATKATGDFDLKTFEVKAVPQTPVEGLKAGMTVLLKQ
ncbi:MAG: HlyD family secretion protein [Bacteroidaceae bacterium]|jgi:HlyD family secretion protein